MSSKLQLDVCYSVEVAPSRECLLSKGTYGSFVWVAGKTV